MGPGQPVDRSGPVSWSWRLNAVPKTSFPGAETPADFRPTLGATIDVPLTGVSQPSPVRLGEVSRQSAGKSRNSHRVAESAHVVCCKPRIGAPSHSLITPESEATARDRQHRGAEFVGLRNGITSSWRSPPAGGCERCTRTRPASRRCGRASEAYSRSDAIDCLPYTMRDDRKH